VVLSRDAVHDIYQDLPLCVCRHLYPPLCKEPSTSEPWYQPLWNSTLPTEEVKRLYSWALIPFATSPSRSSATTRIDTPAAYLVLSGQDALASSIPVLVPRCVELAHNRASWACRRLA
jgi:hypothetical protein